MNPILWITFGAIIGWIALLMTEPKQPQHGSRYIFIGMISAFFSGLLANFIWTGSLLGFNIISVIAAVTGAILTLWGVFVGISR